MAQMQMPGGSDQGQFPSQFPFPSGTLMLFQQTASPIGWTKQTTHNDKALRVVSGTASSGGANTFSSTLNTTDTLSFGGNTLAPNNNFTDGHALTINEIPSHSHNATYQVGTGGAGYPGFSGNGDAYTTGATTSVGGGAAHTHTMGGHTHDMSHNHSLTLNIQYVDTIIASKD